MWRGGSYREYVKGGWVIGRGVHRLKILIADDDKNIRRVLSIILSREGFDPVMAEDGNQALEILESADAPRLAVLDWMMPGVDGPGVCRRVRATQSEETYKYLVLLTARGAQTDIISGMNAGADDYVVKPFDEQELRVRLRAGKRIVDLQHQLVQRNETLKDFVYALSHDMRTPLLALDLTISQALGESFGPLPDEYMSILRKSRCTVKELSTMTSTLLGVGRFEHGADTKESVPVDLRMVLNACVTELEPIWSDKGVSVSLEIDPVATVIGDQQMLRRMLLNLLDNAIKFTPSGKSIEIVLKNVDGTIQVSVRDGGEGVLEEDQPFLFQRFAVRRHRHKGVGTGLGLFLCRRIAEEHGGTVRYQKSEEAGSCFIVTLPL